jgi:hypothetical protein
MVRAVRPYAERIARFDRDLARQLRKSSTAVPLNLAEGAGLRGGRLALHPRHVPRGFGHFRPPRFQQLDADRLAGMIPSYHGR